MLRQRGNHTVIDKITVNLDIKEACYKAEFSNLGLKGIPISEDCLLMSSIAECLTDLQRRRMWMFCVDGISTHAIAKKEIM